MPIRLTRPIDLKRRVNRVYDIITAIEAKFSADNRLNCDSSPKRVIDVIGDFDLVDKQTVCLKYKEAGWEKVTHKMFVSGRGRITVFTFIAE